MEEHRVIETDVAVVGAGLSGLTAADALVAAGHEVAVLEARDRVGGRVRSHPIGDGEVVELGGEYFGPLSTKITDLARRLDVDERPVRDEGAKLCAVAGEVRRYRGFLPKVGVTALADCAQGVARFERMARAVPPAAPWTAPRAAEWDHETLASWTRRTLRTRRGREVFTMGVEAIYCAHGGELSLLHTLQYAHSYGSFRYLGSVLGGSQERRFAGGAQTLAERLAAPLGDRVVLGAPVRELAQDGGAVRLAGPGVTVRARRAIVALPPVLAARLAYAPALPARRDQLLQRLPAGSVVKVLTVYDRPFWREAGLSGMATATAGPLRAVFDASPDLVTGRGVLGAFAGGSAAQGLARLAPGERRRVVLDALVRLYGDAAGRPEAYYEHDWSADPYTRGC